MLSYGSVLENQVVFADFRQLENGNEYFLQNFWDISMSSEWNQAFLA